MAYNPNYILYYDGVAIEPTPTIEVNKEPIYAGDNVIGFTYVVDIKGYASSVKYSTSTFNPGMHQSIVALSDIEKCFQKNGKTLILYNNSCGTQDLVANGGHLKSFNVEEGQWFNYIKFSASLEFTDLYFRDSDGNLTTGISADSVAVTDPVMAVAMLKIKSYNDSWNFTIPENEAYMYYARVAYINESTNKPVMAAEDYSQINVEYTISANGKHYYNANDQSKAAWEAAKDFVQYKLYYQIASFRDKKLLSNQLFETSYYDSTETAYHTSNEALTSNFFVNPAIPPILDRTIMDRYAIYNENIKCSTSESDGSFSATYSCILKRFDLSIAAPKNSIHNFTVNYEQTNDFKSSNRTITVNGTLQGLLLTNILANINDGQNFILPSNGLFFVVGDDVNTKYAMAWEDFMNYIAKYDLSDPNYPIIDDLRPNFKDVLAINYASLFPNTYFYYIYDINGKVIGTEIRESNQSPCLLGQGYNQLYQVLAEPKSFNVSHNYSEGTISYTATYDTERSCAKERGFQSLTITEDDDVPIYAEHTVVGRTRGTLLQNLNTNKPKTITIKFQGVTRKGCVGGHPFTTGYADLDPRYSGISADVCDTDGYIFLPQGVLFAYDQTELAAQVAGMPLIRRSNNVTYNPVDGSYSIDRSYTVCPRKPTNLNCDDQIGVL